MLGKGALSKMPYPNYFLSGKAFRKPRYTWISRPSVAWFAKCFASPRRRLQARACGAPASRDAATLDRAKVVLREGTYGAAGVDRLARDLNCGPRDRAFLYASLLP
jgi:hypothetical protein